jgi:type 1 glutamine amidotransferase
MEPVRVLLVTKGHAFDHDAFLAMFEEMEDLDVTMVEQPAAQVILRPENVGPYDAVLFYDMSGIPGIGLMHDGAGDTGIPPEDYRRSIEALIHGGIGIVMLNHGTVSWPLWPLWRSISGSSFMLTEGELNGERVSGSGYRGGHGPYPNPTINLAPVDPAHPVAAGLEDGFTVTDEIYLKTEKLGPKVTPLFRSDYEFVAENFTPPPLAPPEEQADWSHPEGSNVVVWANVAGNSPVVAADIGDSPEAFGNADFRRLLRNALKWVASADAREWAAKQ